MTRRDSLRSILGLGLGFHGLSLPSPAGAATALGRVREALQRFVDRKEVAGAVAVVGDGGGMLAVEAVGLRDVEAGLPMAPDTIFRVASMTKPITAIAVLMLADEGKLGLDDPVEKYLPEFRGQQCVVEKTELVAAARPPTRPIRLRDLLTHTSGLPDKSDPAVPASDAREAATLADAVRAYAYRRLDFEPGLKWAYSNAGIATLGRVVEVVSGRPYEESLQDRLFTPLGMVDTTFFPTPEQMKRTAVTYDRKDESLRAVDSSRVAPVRGQRYPNPAGGLYATAGDMARLDRMLLNRGVDEGRRRSLSETSFAEMTRVQTGDLKVGFVDGMGFGLGVGVVRTPSGVTEALSPGTFGHGGAFGTQSWIDPRKRRFAILMIQRAGMPNGDASEIRRDFQAIAFGPGD